MSIISFQTSNSNHNFIHKEHFRQREKIHQNLTTWRLSQMLWRIRRSAVTFHILYITFPQNFVTARVGQHFTFIVLKKKSCNTCMLRSMASNRTICLFIEFHFILFIYLFCYYDILQHWILRASIWNRSVSELNYL